MTRNLDRNLVAMPCPVRIAAGRVGTHFIVSSSKPMQHTDVRWHAFDNGGKRTYEVGTVHQHAKGNPYATYPGSNFRYYHHYNADDKGLIWGDLGTPLPCSNDHASC
jgi:hypothetical protein